MVLLAFRCALFDDFCSFYEKADDTVDAKAAPTIRPLTPTTSPGRPRISPSAPICPFSGMSSSSKKTASASRPSSSASVVSALQRASFGVHTLPTGATDEDIAKMIADEAKKKETIWKEFGLGVYAPRP